MTVQRVHIESFDGSSLLIRDDVSAGFVWFVRRGPACTMCSLGAEHVRAVRSAKRNDPGPMMRMLDAVLRDTDRGIALLYPEPEKLKPARKRAKR